MSWSRAFVFVFSGGLSFLNPCSAVELEVYVTQKNGRPLYQSLIGFSALDQPSSQVKNKKKSALAQPKVHRVLQKNQQFSPQLLAIKTNDSVQFINLDQFSHHVYSLSKGNQFQLPLFGPKDGQPAPVKMSKPGLVTVGCNIHDNMMAKIFVLNDDQVAVFSGSPARFFVESVGTYKLKIFHLKAPGSQLAPVSKTITISEAQLKNTKPLQIVVRAHYDLASEKDSAIDKAFED